MVTEFCMVESGMKWTFPRFVGLVADSEGSERPMSRAYVGV